MWEEINKKSIKLDPNCCTELADELKSVNKETEAKEIAGMKFVEDPTMPKDQIELQTGEKSYIIHIPKTGPEREKP